MPSTPPMPLNDRITARLMRSVTQIERMISEGMSLSELAGAAALSEYHFHRLFRAHFGVSVMDYVRRRRLAVAAKALLTTRSPVLHIAFDAGFQSQAAFTRAFRKVYYTTPALYRSRARDVPWLSSVPISNEVLAMLPGLGSDQPRLEVIEGLTLEGLRMELDSASRAEIPQLWQRLAQVLGTSRFSAAEHFGLSAGNEAILEGVLGYWAAVRADEATTPHPQLARLTVAGGPYLVFGLEGDAALVSDAYDYIFATWLPGSSHALRSGPSFTRQREGSALGASDNIEIWIPVEAV